MRSLTFKLVLAFVAVCLTEAVLVAVLVRQATQREFDRFVQEDAAASFTEKAADYYREHGSWEGVEHRFSPGNDRPRRPAESNGSERREGPPPQGAGPVVPPRFGLVDTGGLVVLSNGSYRIGERIPVTGLKEGKPLLVDGVIRATVIFPTQGIPFGPAERAYLARTDSALLVAAFGALAVAIALGIWIARTATRPVRELTAATHAVARGDLGRQVAVRSQDEVGQLVDAFNRMSRELAEATDLRRRMTADIAHDLRTPLTVLSGYLEALRDGDLAPSRERFEMMYVEARHLGRLVEDLRTLSLADAGELPLHIEQLPPADLLERVRDAFARQAEECGVALTVESEPSVPDLAGDADRLAQVLANLVGNALRYTPSGGTILLVAERRSESVALQVRDSGRGISSEALPHIFERFYRGDSSRQRTDGESGLGLAIARSVVEAHGGTISVESSEGTGTVFTLLMPLAV